MSKAKQTAAAVRSARTRRLKQQIATIANRSRRRAWDEAFQIVLKENPKGCSEAFCRWFDEAWVNAIKPGAP